MKIIAIKDREDRGYTAFHVDFPSVVVQTETTEEINQKLADVFHDIMMNSEVDEKELLEQTI